TLGLVRFGSGLGLVHPLLPLLAVQLVRGLASLLAVASPLFRGGDQHRGVQLLFVAGAHRSSPRLRTMFVMRSGVNHDPSPRTRFRRSSSARRAASAFVASWAGPVFCGPSPAAVVSSGGGV